MTPPNLARTTLLVLALAASSVVVAAAEDKGQQALDEALDTKLNAGSLFDLGRVVTLCEQALEDGLSGDNQTLCRRLLGNTLLERAEILSGSFVDVEIVDPTQLPQLVRLRELALKDLDRGVELLPEAARGHLLIGQLQALPGGDEKLARRALSKAVELAADDVGLKLEALVARAEIADEAEDRQADLDAAAEIAPNDVDVLLARGEFHLQQGRFEQGLADANKALESDPNSLAALQLRGVALAMLKKYDEAKEALDKAIELEPASFIALAQRARLNLIQGDGKGAVADATKAMAIGLPTPELLLLRAGGYETLGQNEKAAKDIDAALEMRPDFAPALRARAMLAADSGKIGDAIGDLELLQEKGDDDPQLLLQLAMLYYSNKQIDKSIDALTHVLEKDPKNSLAHQVRADAYLSQGKHAEAVADYDKSLEHDPKSDHVLNNLAWLLATSPDDKLRDGKRALDLATTACEVTGYKQPHVLSTLAAAHAELGDFDQARQWSKKAVELATGEVVDSLKKELESYEAGKPWREEKLGE